MNLTLTIVLFLIFVIFSVVFLIIESNNIMVKRFKHFIMAMLIGLGMSLFWLIPIFSDVSASSTYNLVQLITVIVGLWLVQFAFRNSFEQYNKRFLSTILISGVCITFAWFCSDLLLALIQGLDHSFYSGSAYLVGLFPVLFSIGFYFQQQIPEPYFKYFEWPDGSQPVDREYVDMDNVAIISIECKYKETDKQMTEVQFKAPYNYLLRDYFYDYMLEMNESQGMGIEYMYGEEDFYKWLFYIKPKKFWESKKYLDPDRSLYENEIKEYCTIVFERLIEE